MVTEVAFLSTKPKQILNRTHKSGLGFFLYINRSISRKNRVFRSYFEIFRGFERKGGIMPGRQRFEPAVKRKATIMLFPNDE